MLAEDHHFEADAFAGGCEAAQAGFAQGGGKVFSDFAHRFDHIVSRDFVRQSGQGHIGADQGIDRTDCIALDAGNLDQSGNRIADEAEQIADSHRHRFRCLLRRATCDFDGRSGSHPGCAPDFGLAPSGSTGNHGIVCDHHAKTTGTEQHLDHLLFRQTQFVLDGEHHTGQSP